MVVVFKGNSDHHNCIRGVIQTFPHNETTLNYFRTTSINLCKMFLS